jgi:hypothetical protein
VHSEVTLHLLYTILHLNAHALSLQGDVYALFIAYIGTLRREFDVEKRAYSSSSSSGMTQGQLLRPNEPQYAGSALWACSLAKLAQASWELLKGCKYMAKHAVRCVCVKRLKVQFCY